MTPKEVEKFEEENMTEEQREMSRKRKIDDLIDKHIMRGDELCCARTTLVVEMMKNSDLIEAEQLITIINQGIHQENDDIAFVENFLMKKWKNIKGSDNVKYVLRNIPEELSRRCVYKVSSDKLLNKISVNDLIDLIE